SAVKMTDGIAIFTGHSQYRSLAPGIMAGTVHPVLIDGRNIVDPDRFIEQGWIYKGIGRGDKNEHPLQ
ncbi:MAG: nucleotide sugar dehydrogenase, partial [Methanoregulaceae archaeon]|nr:nucleotide sugar dehydrogenase [Methanoregulaceae archaeon]